MTFDVEVLNSTVLEDLLNEEQKELLSNWISEDPRDDDRMNFTMVANFIKKYNMDEKKYILCLSKTFNNTFVDEFDATCF